MQENRAASITGKGDADILRYLEIVLRRKRFILAVTVPAFVVLLALSLLSSPVYQSTSRFLPPPQDQGLASLMLGQMGGNLSSLAGSVLGAGTLADQYASILTSERIRDTIIDRFNLMIEYKKKYRLKMYKEMDKIVKVRAGKKDGIISVTVEDKDAQKAADIANAYVDELGKLVTEMSTSSAGQNRAFLEKRLTVAKADLAKAEDAMKGFQSRNRAISVPDQARASIEGVAMLKAQVAAQEAQLSALRSQFTDSTNEVQAVKASIAKLNAQIRSLEGLGTGAVPSIGSVPQLGQEQVRLLREFKIQETLVELLTKQNELAKLTESRTVSTIQVIQRARPADYHVKLGFRKRHVVALTALVFAATVLWVLFDDYRRRIPAEQKARWAKVLWQPGN